MILLQISYWMCRWKNYENRSIFSEDMDKRTACYFFWDTVYIHSAVLPQYSFRTDQQTDSRTDRWSRRETYTTTRLRSIGYSDVAKMCLSLKLLLINRLANKG